DELLAYLAGLEQSANHPIADGILAQAKKENVQPKEATGIQAHSGIGIEGMIAGEKWQIVNQKGVEKYQTTIDPDQLNKYQEQGNTISYLVKGNQVEGLVALGDKIKPEAVKFIETLKKQGITPVMLTGDNQAAAKAVATYLGIDEYFAELLPEDKERIVADYLNKKQRVAMVGDVIND
ncbi:HAD family hydrolase, partial [Klebsiella pneumoniae]|uniref:HAD-IC family P-type ATPase n=1 Tax=Klebsiella pneumoniae TaxID=573 RepID=UPI0011E8827D